MYNARVCFWQPQTDAVWGFCRLWKRGTGSEKEQFVVGLFRRSAAEQAQDEARIQASLSKTRQGFFGRISSLFQASEISEDTWTSWKPC